MSEQQLIIESQLLTVRQDDDKNWWLRGVFGKADHVGKNNRSYPKAVLEAAISEYIRDKVLAGAAYGTLDHEPSVSVSLKESAIRIVRLWWEGNDLMGEAIVLNTEQGRNLQAILEAGGTVGVSTRGSGVQKGDGTISSYRISSVDVVSQPANTGGQFVTAVYEDEQVDECHPVNRTDNVDGLDDGNARRLRPKTVKRILSHIKRRSQRRSTLNLNPRTEEDPYDPAAHSDAARTTHPSRRGHQGMKREDFPNTDSKKYLSPDSKVPTTKGKPKFLRPKGSKKGMLEIDEAVVTGMLKAVATHFGTKALRSTPVGKDIYGAAKAMHTAWRSQKPKGQSNNTNLPKSQTQVLNKGTVNEPKRMKTGSALWKSNEKEFKENLLYKWQNENKDVKAVNERTSAEYDEQRNQMIAGIIDGQNKLKGLL